MKIKYFQRPHFSQRGSLYKTLLVMKLTSFFLLIFFLQATAKTEAQVKISISAKNIPLSKVFEEIEKQSGYIIWYETKLLEYDVTSDISIVDATLVEALNISLKNLPLEYEIVDKIITIKKKADRVERAIALLPIGEVRIQGHIVDEKGEPIEGATISIKGTKKSTFTNAQGDFSLAKVDQSAILVITHVGFAPKEYTLKGESQVVISLKVAANSLENVEVKYNSGYENIPRERATGSFVQIDNNLFNRKVSTNVLDRIYEVTSGLVFFNQAQNQSDVPALTVRGVSTINSNSAPLIVVDNFPYGGDINNLNPNDVESITVLKDAAAASIWGARAGNGVIVITTKKGKYYQKAKMSLTSNVTIGRKPDLSYVHTISSPDEITYEKLQFSDSLFNVYDDQYPSYDYFPALPQVAELLLSVRRGTITQAQADAQIALYQDHAVQSDINKYLLQSSINQQYAFNISGGGNNYNYYGSIGFDNNRASEVGNQNKRLTLMLNNVWRPIRDLEINGGITYAQTQGSQNLEGYQSYLPVGLQLMTPYTQLADASGNPLAIPRDLRLSYVDTATYPALLDWHYKPLNELKDNSNTIQGFDTRLNTSIHYYFSPGFTASALYQYQKVFNNSTINYSPNSYAVRSQVNEFMNVSPLDGSITYPFPLGSILNQNDNQSTSWNFRGQLNFARTWGKHSLVFLAGSELGENTTTANISNIIGYDDNLSIAPVVDITTPIEVRPGGYQTPIGGSPLQILSHINRFGSYYANGAYTFSEKYVLTGSGRVDQSNLFGVNTNHQRVPLWSAGLGWNLSKEGFYKVSWLPRLNLRATYGYNGNNNTSITSFATIYYNSNTYSLPTRAINASLTHPPNPDLRWEKIKNINFGVDFGSRNNQITGTLEFYVKNGIDLLGPILTDPTTGIFQYTGNTSNMSGHGIDLTLNSESLIGSVKWSTTLLFSYNTDKVTSYQQQPSTLGQLLVNQFYPVVGKPLFTLYSFNWAGLDSAGAPQIYIGKSKSGFGNSSQAKPEDMVYSGSRRPIVFGSIRNEFKWKQLAFSFNITYKLGYYFRRSSFDYNQLYYSYGGNADYTKRWQKQGDEKITNVPALPSGAPDGRDYVYLNSNILVERADNIRLQDIRLSYSLDKVGTVKLPFKSELYLYAGNLGILWRANKYGIDPEAYLFGSIPDPKTFSFGININF